MQILTTKYLGKLSSHLLLLTCAMFASAVTANPSCTHFGASVICPSGIPAGSTSTLISGGSVFWDSGGSSGVPLSFVACPPSGSGGSSGSSGSSLSFGDSFSTGADQLANTFDPYAFGSLCDGANCEPNVDNRGTGLPFKIGFSAIGNILFADGLGDNLRDGDNNRVLEGGSSGSNLVEQSGSTCDTGGCSLGALDDFVDPPCGAGSCDAGPLDSIFADGFESGDTSAWSSTTSSRPQSSSSTAGDEDFDINNVNFDDLDNIEGDAYGDGSFQTPFSGEALNRALGLDEDTAPATTMQRLQQMETELEQEAIKANNHSNTVADAFVQSSATSTQTSSSMAAAQDAQAVQEFLIDFGSALADLASVSDFFENLAKGDMSDDSIIQKIDAIYEAAKDGESLLNNIADQVTPAPEGGTSPINDAFGTMGTADEFLGTDGLTNLNSLKSDASDLISLIDDYRGGKPVNPRTIGQLAFRFGKGLAENNLAERKQHIATLQGNLAAEQRVTSGLAGELQGANDIKFGAIDKLDATRSAIGVLIEAHPESLAGSQTDTSPVVPITTEYGGSQPIADQINTARQALYDTGQRIDVIENRVVNEGLQSKKRKLTRLRSALSSWDQGTAGYRDSLRETDLPVLGEHQETQNIVNLRAMDRLAMVNEITRLETEIEIEEGNPEAEIATLQEARTTLRSQLTSLRYQLYVSEENQGQAAGADMAQLFSGIFGLEVINR